MWGRPVPGSLSSGRLLPVPKVAHSPGLPGLERKDSDLLTPQAHREGSSSGGSEANQEGKRQEL